MRTKTATRLATDAVERVREGEILPLRNICVGFRGGEYRVWVGDEPPAIYPNRQEAIKGIVVALMGK